MLETQNNRKAVTVVTMLVVLAAAMAAAFHLAGPAMDSHTSAEGGTSAAALQFKQNQGASSSNSDDEFSTPPGWEKLAPVNPSLDYAKELEIISVHAKDSILTPSGWEKITSAGQTGAAKNPQPALPLLSPPAIALEAEPHTKSPDISDENSTAAASLAGSTSPSKVFPTEQRVWTNYLGKLTVASVLECNFDTGELLMKSKNGILRTYELTQLSDADRDYLWSLVEQE